MAAGRAYRIADTAVGIVGTLEPRGIGFDEAFNQCYRRRGIRGHQLAFDLTEPGFEQAAVLARLAVVVEPGRSPPGSQGLLEAGRELVRAVGQLHSSQALLNCIVVGGQLEQDGNEDRNLLSLQEGFQTFGGLLGHWVSVSERVGG